MDFSVEQNVEIGLHYGQGEDAGHFVDSQKRADQILTLLGLGSKRRELVKNLTLVDRKFVEVARALGTDPKLLLLDEVLSGLNPVERENAVRLIKSLSESFGITIVWIEHIMQSLLAICERFVVLLQGTKLAEGDPKEVVSDERVIEAYLGRGGKMLIAKGASAYHTEIREG